MSTEIRLGPWAPSAVNERYGQLAATLIGLDARAILQRLEELVAEQARLVDRECFNLNPATSIQNPRAALLLASGIGNRPSLGYPGDKYETGLAPAEQIEVITVELARRLFRCTFAETRVLSGAMANIAVFMATTHPGDVIFTLPPSAGGHATHQSFGAPGLYGLDVRSIPLIIDQSTATWQIDFEALAIAVIEARPRLLVLGGSLALAPYSIREVREIADRVGARLLFDGAHLSQLIAGGAFQDPLGEGADLMTTSTYKALGGPPGGLIVTNDAELAARLAQIVYPGLTANNDLGRVSALAVALNDQLVFGRAYAATCIAAAQKLAQALATEGFSVAGYPAQYTQTHHVAVDARPWAGGTRAAKLLERANILATGIGLPLAAVEGDWNGLRFGTQELVRWGMKPAQMSRIADLVARVLLRGEDAAAIRDEVIAWRGAYQHVHYTLA